MKPSSRETIVADPTQTESGRRPFHMASMDWLKSGSGAHGSWRARDGTRQVRHVAGPGWLARLGHWRGGARTLSDAPHYWGGMHARDPSLPLSVIQRLQFNLKNKNNILKLNI